jgi:hypothetical protein
MSDEHDESLVMKAINALAANAGNKILVNPPTGPAQDWPFDSHAEEKDQKGDCLVTVVPI